MTNTKLPTPKIWFKFLLIALVLCALAVPLVHAHSVLAAACPVDPEDLAAPPPPDAPDQSNCPTADSYLFIGDPNSPQIQVGTVNAGGKTVDANIATLSLVDSTADPLVWSGPVNYGDQHTLQLSISRSDFTNDFSKAGGIGFFNRVDNPGPNQGDWGSVGVSAASGSTYNISSLTNGVATNKIICSDTNGVCDNVIVDKYLTPIIRFLAAGVGIIVTAMVVIGGIEYSMAGGDPQKVSAAKQKIFNALIALVAFALIDSLLQFLVPGGIKVI